jgi:anti-anti-sigma factor
VDILQETHGQVLLVAPSGRLDSETSGELELVLHDAGIAGRRHFVVDLSGVGYVSSAGLRVLLALAKRLDGGVGSLRLCGLSANVRQVFDIAGFTSMFSLYPNRHAALDQHPHMLDTSARLLDAATALLGIQRSDPPVGGHAEQTAAAANLLGVPASQDDLQKRSTVVGPAVAAVTPTETDPAKHSGSRWKRLFGKD